MRLDECHHGRRDRRRRGRLLDGELTPQLAKIWREKASGQVSLGMYALTVGAFVLWIGYGALLGSWPLVAANVVSLALASAILGLQLRYRGRQPATPSRPAR